jgi:SAM-dependent methyltransferase
MKIGSGETGNPIWQLLRNPTLYDFVQRIAGSDRVRREFVGQYMRPDKGDRILDLGCGTGDLLACMTDISYVGIDLNEDYIATARDRYPERGTFLVGDATEFYDQVTGPFDIIVAFGLLHHLDDRGASALVSAAPGLLISGGRFLAVDPCFDPTQNAIQRWMVSRDRGRAVRSPEGYRKLFPSNFTVEHAVRHNWGNIPWSYCVLTATAK